VCGAPTKERILARPDPREIATSIRNLLLGHRERVVAGVPGCSCKVTYPGSTVRELSFYHADHLSRLVAAHLLEAMAAREPVPV
jgi:hypothetical protein